MYAGVGRMIGAPGSREVGHRELEAFDHVGERMHRVGRHVPAVVIALPARARVGQFVLERLCEVAEVLFGDESFERAR